MRWRSEIGLIYVIGLVQGLALVTFPAASSIFTSSLGFGFSASRYGMMFIPQVALAILASSLGPRLARRWTLKRVLQAGLAADLLAMILLAASRLLVDVPGAAYAMLLVATGSLGFGFGAAVMAMNTYAQTFCSGPRGSQRARAQCVARRGHRACAAVRRDLHRRWRLVADAVDGGHRPDGTASPQRRRCRSRRQLVTWQTPRRAERLPRRFWLFAAAVLLYGVAETLNGNWSGPYLTGERGLSAEGASFALMAFWAMVTVGRMLFATVSSERTVPWIYAGLPVVLIAAFQMVSHASGESRKHRGVRLVGSWLFGVFSSVHQPQRTGVSATGRR